MPKWMKYFLVLFVFVLGVSAGTYLGIEKREEELPQETQRETEIIPVQDVVIRNLQAKIDELSKSQPTVVETMVEETKLSPYAKMKIEKKFTKCGHTVVEVKDIPLELINMTESDILKKYADWEVRSFSTDEVYLYREIEANCNDHFVLKEQDGHLAIYRNLGDDILSLKEVTDVDISFLPEEDAETIRKGIFVYGQKMLSSMLEDYSS